MQSHYVTVKLRSILPLLALVFVAGCARLGVDQTPDANGNFNTNTQTSTPTSTPGTTPTTTVELDGKPVIEFVSPSSGPVGTRVTLTGIGFSRATNSINFAGVNNAIIDISSTSTRSLTFTIPATPCSQRPKAVCAQVTLNPGPYPLTVTNANGTSNTVAFRVIESGDGVVQHSTENPLGRTTWPLAKIDDRNKPITFAIWWATTQ